jgi:hypothetical protein
MALPAHGAAETAAHGFSCAARTRVGAALAVGAMAVGAMAPAAARWGLDVAGIHGGITRSAQCAPATSGAHGGGSSVGSAVAAAITRSGSKKRAARRS